MNDLPTLPAAAIAALWQHAPWGIALIDAAGRIAEASPRCAQLLELSSATLRGTSEADFDALLRQRQLDYRRSGLRDPDRQAIYFVSAPPARDDCLRRMTQAAELLREPLAGCYGFAELLLTQDYDEATRRDLIATQLGQLEALADIINRRLDMSQVQP